MIAPSYHLAVASSLSLDTGYLFLVCYQVFLSMVVQQLVAIMVLLQEEMTLSFYSAIFDWKPDRNILNDIFFVTLERLSSR